MAMIWRVVAKDVNGHTIHIWECTNLHRALKMVETETKAPHEIHSIKFLYVEVGS